MHLRRWLLLIAVILGLAALAASLAPSGRRGGTGATQTAAAPPPTADVPPPATITFRAQPSGRHRQQRTARSGDHVTVEVTTSSAGEAAIPALGLLAAAEPGTPASFDVIVPPPGRYELRFARPFAQPAQIGTLVARGG